jgi:hypothetical protein
MLIKQHHHHYHVETSAPLSKGWTFADAEKGM